MAHGGANASKKIAFAAVKNVIEQGTLVYRASHGRIDSFYMSAPVRISERDNIVTVLVRRDPNTQRMYLHSVALKENLLKLSVSAVDAEASERGSATTSGEVQTVPKPANQGKASSAEVARELNRLLTLDTRSKQGDAGEPMFSRSRFMDPKDSALSPLDNSLSRPGKVSKWDKTEGSMHHQRSSAFCTGDGPVQHAGRPGPAVPATVQSVCTVARRAVFRALLERWRAEQAREGAGGRAVPGSGRGPLLDESVRRSDQSGAAQNRDLGRGSRLLAGLAGQGARLANEEPEGRIFYSRRVGGPAGLPLR